MHSVNGGMKLVNWRAELERSKYDHNVGIRIAKLAGNPEFCTYLTVIDPGKAVVAHFHKHGDEHYHIVQGEGEVTLTDIGGHETITTTVCGRSSFVVPPNTLHRLRNSGAEQLILMFSCPESHLDSDRFFL